MIINKVTITGADNEVSPRDLLLVGNEYPFAEWGILFSKSKSGHPRYPTPEWINKLTLLNINLSAHFCGWYSKEVLENKNYRLIDGLSKQFKRVQLNYNFSFSRGWDLYALCKYARENEDRAIILQYNRHNEAAIDITLRSFNPPSNIHVLHDSSGGRGAEIKEIPPPLPCYTGYSGGVNTENIDSICANICRSKYGGLAWIDMESGVRTNNKFDLSKAEDILEKSTLFVKGGK